MNAPAPRVSFVVTCYKMAHALAECLTSILAQSYRDYEVLIMDDCSPDQTPAVAARFRDPRIRYIRSSVSLGQVKNYNEALRRARGEYVWLISAEDRLCRPYVLQRFVELLDRHPNVGLAFCPGVTIDRDGREGEIQGSMGGADAIIAGPTFLSSLIESNCICRPAVMARRTCYERMGLFPLDLPYAGHWYVWCFIALHSDVAYFSEPMVNDRLHAGNGTRLRARETPHVVIPDVINLRHRLKRLAEERRLPSIARACSAGLAAVDVSLGDDRYDSGEFLFARHYYIRALRQNPWNVRTLAKVAMTCLGTRGAKLWRMMGAPWRDRRPAWESSFGAQRS
jgi:glycosyltransferase involved in cell wall biosynthesis